MTEEIWKDIPEYEGLYQVSNLGNVRSLNYMKTRKIKELKQMLTYRGYYVVHLSKDSIHKKALVHRLVAQAFIPNSNNNLVVNHIDENKKNNTLQNLEWCTQKYNINWGTSLYRRSKTQTNRKDCSKPVLQFDLNGNFIKEFPSQKEAFRQTEINLSGINACCKGRKHTAGGYIWKYKEE